MKYPHIEKLGLPIKEARQFTDSALVVYCSDLESLLASAQMVYGHQDKNNSQWYYASYKSHSDDVLTHTALLIAVEEIRKGVTKKELLDALSCLAEGSVARDWAHVIKCRIEKEGIRE